MGKRHYFILLFLLAVLPVVTIAQVQNGYVRTKGTSTNRYGSPIPQVQVFISGFNGAKVTAANGTFNFNLGGGKTQYSVSSVVKTGYSLCSPLASSYNVGNARLELVMQSRTEKRAEEARITEKVEANITKSYETKMAKLQKDRESMKNALASEKQNTDFLKKQINALEERIAVLDQQYQKRYDLIDKMVEEYVNLDYATLDDRKAQLCAFIENGELERADSLLSTIDITTVMSDIKTLDTDIKEKESQVATEKDVRKQKIETACMYWRGKYDVAVQNMQYDSAMVYIKQLADLDTMNYANVFDCAQFLQKQNEYGASSYYYQICKNILDSFFGHGTNLNKANSAIIDMQLAIMYNDIYEFEIAKDYNVQALNTFKELMPTDSATYRPYIASCLENLSTTYARLKQYDKAEACLLQTLQIRKSVAMGHSSTIEIFTVLYNLGELYADQGKYKLAENYLLQAMDVIQTSKDNLSAEYKSYSAKLLSGLSGLYINWGNIDKAQTFCLQSIEAYRLLANSNQKAYKPSLSKAYHDIAVLCKNNHSYADAESYCLQALALQMELMRNQREVYIRDYISDKDLLATIYHKQQKNDKAISCFKEVIELLDDKNIQKFDCDQQTLVNAIGDLGNCYADVGKTNESKECFLKALGILQRLVISEPERYSCAYGISSYNLAGLFMKLRQYTEAEKYLLHGMEKMERMQISKKSRAAEVYSGIMKMLIDIYRKTGRESEAEKCKAKLEFKVTEEKKEE